MIDTALITKPGGRTNNEDYIKTAEHGSDNCYILCDGLGGHDCGEVASQAVAEYVAAKFANEGDSRDFLAEAFKGAQEMLLKLQKERGVVNAMKTTLVVLVVTDSIIKWAHIGDSRLYRIYDNYEKYERTRDHSMVQILLDMGEITEDALRTHEDRNKLLRVMGAEWSAKSFDLSGVIERGEKTAFALMTDGFWEYVTEKDMLYTLRNSANSTEWLSKMTAIVEAEADMTRTDNYSAICVRID